MAGCSPSPPALIVVLLLAAFWAYCLFDLARTSEWEVRTYPKQVWLLLLVFTNFIGALFWLAKGRPERPNRRTPR